MSENKIKEIVPTALYTPVETMDYLRIKSRSTLHYWERDGKLIPRRMRGGYPRYLGEDILALVNADAGGKK